ncbi:hypothetical protein GCM10010123_07410 [Pilimelia anulata]|uniref:Uncharacterized protein n=1 Tax=Pilimelia anulata TaxID=53371 RepID=A0A8J3F6G6_9ACTN|nr:peptidase inhibitor family I36 protein [Pilimelia anulata]GGJ80050.1 hypothetical protein GCM10010123_07410 [Pilimelia anulata]
MDEPQTRPAGVPAAEKVLATFEGKRIDLSQGWGEARVCDVHSPRDIRCYRTPGEAADGRGTTGFVATGRAEPTAFEDCPKDWLCIWDTPNFNGRMAKVQDDTPVELDSLGLRNNVGSWANRQRDPGGLILTGNAIHDINPNDKVANGRQVGNKAEKVFG